MSQSGEEPEKDQVDQDLDSLLSGTLGWAQGLTPEVDSQGDQLVGSNHASENESKGSAGDQNDEDSGRTDRDDENDSPSAGTAK